MMITNSCWQQIREQFTEAEKDALRAVITGSVICPAGIVIDETKLDVVLEFKILQAVKVAGGNA